jgi:hypothetical protein
VSGTELSDLEALLERVLPDPMGFADRLLSQLMDRLAADNGAAPTIVTGYDAEAHEALADRQLLLAAALGACDCWGQDPHCAVCSGEGRSGWTEPDADLFAEYVEPALSRSPERLRAPNDQDEQPAEGNDP